MTASWSFEIEEGAEEAGGVRLVHRGDDPSGARWAPWRLESIAIRDALVAIQVTHANQRVDDPRDRETLAAMVRTIGHAAGERGLLRPLVVYLRADAGTPSGETEGHVRDEEARRHAIMKAWEDDQDWHRGRFIFFTDLPRGLLSPKIEGFARATSESEVEDDLHRLAAVESDPRWTGSALLARVRDWATAWKEKNRNASPDEAAIRDLDAGLAAWVATQPLPATSDLPVLVLASYSPDESPPVISGVASTPEAVLHFDHSATQEARAVWDADVEKRLLEVRRVLLARRQDTLVVHARCTSALAMRTGAVFHASQGIVVGVVQRDPGTLQDELWIPTKGRSPQAVELDVERRAPAGTATEIQLRVSATRPVDHDADAWAAAAGTTVNPFILHIAVPSVGDKAIRGADHAWDIARAIRGVLTDTQTGPLRTLPVRIFFAGPTALAIWIGVQLNAIGTVILMDWLKTDERPHYVASFSFRPGA